MKSIPERDWKKLRAMKDDVLAEACDRILSKIDRLIKKKGFNQLSKVPQPMEVVEKRRSRNWSNV